MARGPLPPGFRFHPTDVELVLYYLKRKVLGKPLRIQAITELDLYKFSPWDLPEKSCLRSKDLEWYFFCQKDRKYANGRRTNRATEVGYWKTTGRDRPICNDSQTVGMKKTLIFHLGRAPNGNRTNWVMHEYRLEIKDLEDAGISQDSYVLCKVFEKSGAGPKNGEQHGAPYVEEEWEEDLVENSLAPLALVDSGSPSVILDEEKISAAEDSTLLLGKSCESSSQPVCGNASSQLVCRNTSPQPLWRNASPQPICRNASPQPICRNASPQPFCRNPSPQPFCRNPSPQPFCRNPSPQPFCRNPSPQPFCRNTSPQPFCRNPSPQPIYRKASPEPICRKASPQPICQNASSDASGETLSLLEDADMDTKPETSGEENDQCQSGNIHDEETCVSALLSLRANKASANKASLSSSLQRFREGQRQLHLLLSN